MVMEADARARGGPNPHQMPGMGPPLPQQQHWGAPYPPQHGLPMMMPPGGPYSGPYPILMQGLPFSGPILYPMNGPPPAHLMAMHQGQHHHWGHQPFMQHPQHMQHAQMQAARRMRPAPGGPHQQPQHAPRPPLPASYRQPPAPQGRPGALNTQPHTPGHGAASKSAARAMLVQPLAGATARQAQAAGGAANAAAKGARAAAAGPDPEVVQIVDAMDIDSDDSDDAQSPQLLQNDGASGWAWLVDGVLQQVVGYLQGNSAALSAFRATCVNWKACADANMLTLSPKALLPKDLIRLFPLLEDLQLVSCRNVRNRDLYVLANNNLHLTSLVLGDDTNKPWVTNRGIESIAKMTALKFSALHDCNSITNNGITAIRALHNLETLSLRGCRKLTNNGMATIKELTNLTKLNLYGCKRLSDQGLSCLTILPLKALSLGQTRIRKEGLKQVASLTQLTELHLVKEEVGLDGLVQLSALTGLHTLSLRDLKLTNPVVAALLANLTTNLKDLSLFRNQLSNTLIYDTERLHNLTALDLRETGIDDSGLTGFTALVNLKVLKLKPPLNNVTSAPPASSYVRVKDLTQLRSLTVAVPVLGPLQMLSIGVLTGLQELDLGRGYVATPQEDDMLQAHVYTEVAKLTQLTSLDLSRRRAIDKQEAEERKKAGKPKYPKELRVMLEALPRLCYLNLGSTAIEAAAVKKLICKFPTVNIDGRKSMVESAPELANYGLAGTLCVL